MRRFQKNLTHLQRVLLFKDSSQAAGVNITLVIAALTLVLGLLLASPLSINFTASLSFEPPTVACAVRPLVNIPQPREDRSR
jgi:ABC-type phosphate/phosphonate transport system permease subunit